MPREIQRSALPLLEYQEAKRAHMTVQRDPSNNGALVLTGVLEMRGGNQPVQLTAAEIAAVDITTMATPEEYFEALYNALAVKAGAVTV